jgi:hypothetical protein
MKLQNELNGLIEKLETIKTKIPPYAEQLKNTGGYKNFENRLAWDCLHAVVPVSVICEWYTKYDCNDEHISTLARKALNVVLRIDQ